MLFTDGQNEDANSISREELVKQLKEKADPKRPVRVILVGIGNEVNKEELESVAEAGGGGAFVAQDPAKIDEIFLQAIAPAPRPWADRSAVRPAQIPPDGGTRGNRPRIFCDRPCSRSWAGDNGWGGR